MQIYVKENQKLQIGDIIATVDDSRLQTKRKQLQTNIEQARLEQVQTVAQIRALDSQMRYQRDRTHRTIASAQAELKGREYAYQEKKITSITELQEAEVNVKIAQEELYAGQAQLQSALANLRATEASLGAAISKQKRYESVAIKPTFRTSRSNINKLHSPVIQNYSKKN
uniref:biotin/lipoyl-binding protein n=1 Tax=Tolypothrix bouteillei TaxID=1246981 RepID=UPI0038B6452B